MLQGFFWLQLGWEAHRVEVPENQTDLVTAAHVPLRQGKIKPLDQGVFFFFFSWGLERRRCWPQSHTYTCDLRSLSSPFNIFHSKSEHFFFSIFFFRIFVQSSFHYLCFWTVFQCENYSTQYIWLLLFICISIFVNNDYTLYTNRYQTQLTNTSYAQIPDEKFPVLLEYLEGLQGGARETTVQKALALVEESGKAPEDESVQQRAQRAREVIQLLS